MNNTYILVIILVCLLSCQYSKENNCFPAGTWQGVINISGKSLEIRFNANRDSTKKLTLTLDVPVQGIKNFPVTLTSCASDSVIIDIHQGSIQACYAGKFQGDSLTGYWKQNKYQVPLTLRKAKALKRPQNPKAPFPYHTEEIIYFNQDGSIQYGATLTRPKDKGSCPVVILLTGSGQQDQDETIYGHKPFWIIADYLTRRGIAVLRVDDRGVGKTTGEVKQATSKDYAQDALVAINYLKKRPEIDPAKIGLIGHSEGGVIATLVAANNPDVAFVVSLAGPGVPGEKILLSQARVKLAQSGLNSASVDKIVGFHRMLYTIVLDESDLKKASVKARQTYSAWLPAQDSLTKVAMGGKWEEGFLIYNTKWIESIIYTMNIPWRRYFLQYDPLPYLRDIKCPFVALLGQRDTQVLADLNGSGYRDIKKQLGKSNLSVIEFPQLNHFFQHCQTGYIEEVEQIEETIAPEVLETMHNWIKEQTDLKSIR